MSKSGLRRVLEKPLPSQWNPEDLLSLPEAAALFWPTGGPITVTSLRNAVKKNLLEVAEINGKIFTSPSAIGRMCRCDFRPQREDSATRRPGDVKPRRGRPPGPARA
jgi:hypothetical protein